jgi:hypothetical protein
MTRLFRGEKELFNEIKERIIPDLKESEFAMSKYDCYSEKHKIDIELKCRNTHYDNLVIEKIKYDALMERAKVFGNKPIYINSTPKGVWAFRLDEIPEPVWSKRNMPKTTEFRNKTFVSKDVGYYDLSLGVDISDLLN